MEGNHWLLLITNKLVLYLNIIDIFINFLDQNNENSGFAEYKNKIFNFYILKLNKFFFNFNLSISKMRTIQKKINDEKWL